MKSAWVKCVLLGIVLVCLGCNIRMDKEIIAIQRAMGSLVYVGDEPEPPGTTVGKHGSDKLKFPERLLKGRQYIFHRKDTPAPSWVVIERALMANGAEIVYAPRGNLGLAIPIVGGLFFCKRVSHGGTALLDPKLHGGRIGMGRIASRYATREFYPEDPARKEMR